MKHRLAIFGAIALLGLAGLASAGWALELRNERTQLLLNDRQGVVTSGSKLGVHVGDPWRKADTTIRSQFEPRYVLWQVARRTAWAGASPTQTAPFSPVKSG